MKSAKEQMNQDYYIDYRFLQLSVKTMVEMVSPHDWASLADAERGKAMLENISRQFPDIVQFLWLEDLTKIAKRRHWCIPEDEFEYIHDQLDDEEADKFYNEWIVTAYDDEELAADDVVDELAA